MHNSILGRSARAAFVAFGLFLITACAQTGRADPALRALGAELLPFDAPATTFNVWDGNQRAFSIERVDDEQVRLQLDGVGTMATVRRAPEGLYFADEPGLGVPLVKFGARPGDQWEADGTTVRFEGWERLDLAGAGVFDAAHVSERSGDASFQSRISWWFVPDVGIVQVEVARAGLETRRMVRSAP